ncbi:MAG: preprotein translocase subunit YajC [Legionellaceae bacterium]|nr:preprotein translocase subunit YajC [Legionellaceae bacterium]
MLISTAYAATDTSITSPDNLYSFFMMGAIFVLFYFMLIRPQQKRAKAQKDLISALQKGDEVVINGGILGKVNELSDSFLKLNIADNTEITVQRQAITMILPKGTLKSL